MEFEENEQFFDEQALRKAYLNFILVKQLRYLGYSKQHQKNN